MQLGRYFLLLLALLVLGGCTKIGGSVQRWHSITLMIGNMTTAQVAMPPEWHCTSTVSLDTLTLRCVPQAPER